MRIARRPFGLRRMAGQNSGLLEQLEPRALLSSTPLPNIADMRDPNNSVVRVETNFGTIDFEMFDQAAPITVANFLKYVRDGDFDKTFFHRFARNQDNSPFVIQGGLTRLKNTSNTGQFNGSTPATQSWETIPVDAAITNEFNQSNRVRTIAMARQGGAINSATSQWFINLQDNQFLDTVDQGFTVFGRVLDDASWTVVQSIVSGVAITPQGGLFGQAGQSRDGLPTRTGTSFNGVDVNEDQLVTIRDAEAIKPQGIAAFYTYRVVYPEGFAGSNINEFLPLGNPGSTAVQYQVIVRSEVRDARPATGNADFWYRDKVINTGTIQGNRRAGITISRFAAAAQNLVPRQGMPYSIEVWATGPISAMISHYDFGSSTIEAFTQSKETKWTFPDVRKGTAINDFVVWSNADERANAITITFFPEGGGTPIVINRTTEGLRRGGLNINALSEIANGNYAVQVTSQFPITAAVTQYKTTGSDKGGSTALGIVGDGATRAVLPVANVGPAGSTVTDRISVFNPGTTGAFVTLVASFSDGSPDFTITPSALIVAAGSRSSFVLPNVDGLRGKSFSIRYTSGSAPVFVTTQHSEFNDVASNAFAYTAATRHDFAEGFMNRARAGTDLFETLAIYNPYGSTFIGSAPAQQASVRVRFLFTDGFVLNHDVTIDGDGRVQLDLHTFTPLLNQSDNNRFFFSIEVVSDIPVVAMMRHYDTTLGTNQPSGGDSSIGTQRGQVLPLSGLII